jgi:hypothetical protein
VIDWGGVGVDETSIRSSRECRVVTKKFDGVDTAVGIVITGYGPEPIFHGVPDNENLSRLLRILMNLMNPVWKNRLIKSEAKKEWELLVGVLTHVANVTIAPSTNLPVVPSTHWIYTYQPT